MNLSKLFSMQKELDDYIIEKKGLQGVDLLPQKILALQVELGECAQEWRGFKFWSERQTPTQPECNFKSNADGSSLEWKEEYGYIKHPLLEEYVDCLHFILSIGLTIEPNITEEWDLPRELKAEYSQTPTESFNMLFGAFNGIENRDELDKYECYIWVLEIFEELGRLLGFTWNQIESAYTEKWNINKKRQESGY